MGFKADDNIVPRAQLTLPKAAPGPFTAETMDPAYEFSWEYTCTKAI